MRLMEINESNLPDEIYDFLGGLHPDDVGFETFGPYIVYFEGFTDICLDDFYSRQQMNPTDQRYLEPGEPIGHEGLEKEMIDDWTKRIGNSPHLVETDWCGEQENPTFYAVFKNSL